MEELAASMRGSMHRGWGHASAHTRKGGVPGPKGLKRDRSGEAGRGLPKNDTAVGRFCAAKGAAT